MAELSTKPYLIRAIYEWCADAGYTPYLSVKVDQHVRVPMEYVKNGEIVLSVSQQATRNLTMGNDLIQFSARFNGVSREISVPIHAVQAIFARENGHGYFFEPEATPVSLSASTPVAPVLATAPNLQSVVSGASPDAAPSASLADSTIAPSDQPDAPPPDRPKAPPRGNLRIIK